MIIGNDGTTENRALLLTTFIRSFFSNPSSRALFQAVLKKIAACTSTTRMARPQNAAITGLFATEKYIFSICDPPLLP